MEETCNSNYPGLNWSHFHSLANLLSLRNGGQAEASSLSDTVLDEDYSSDISDDEGTISVNTFRAHRIAGSGHGKLKQKFLDCLAEFAANKKGGTAVACSAMRESEDSVSIWIARNEGFSEADEHVFIALEMLLSDSPYSGANLDVRLWEELVSYHQSRIESSYIPDLRASFKALEAGPRKTPPDTTCEIPDPAAALSILRGLLFDPIMNDESTLDRYARLVIATYELRRSSNMERMLNSSESASSKSRKLWANICLLARLRVAFETFKETALTLPSFTHITIALVPRPPAPASPPHRLISLKEAFGILGLDTVQETVQAVMGQNWTLARIEREFKKRQRQKLNIHAEVQLLLHLNTITKLTPGIFPYIGCSKLCCFMCHSFIQSYGSFTTRGSHGRLFRPWTIPSTNGLLPEQTKRIIGTIISVQSEVVKKLVAPVASKVRHERTSVFGGSSVMGTQHDEISAKRAQIDHNLVNRYHSTSSEEYYEPTCDVCERPTKRRCTYCSKGRFCSESCEGKASVYHLFTCSKRPLTSADYLWKSLGEDIIPVDEDVLQDFGFNNVFDASDRSRLFGLYQGIRLFGDITSSDLHEWRVKGIMVEKIKEIYYMIPESNRGQYFPWWLKNLHRLEKPATKEEAERSFAETFFDKAKFYLDPRDRNTHPSELKPETKRDCFFLLSHVLHRCTPNPNTMLYHTFAFVTCRDSAEESRLVDIYQLLLLPSDGSFFYTFHNERGRPTHTASFAEFWKSYENGTLLQLIDSHGLKDFRMQLPHLESFFSVPPSGPHPSVWDLKQFLENADPLTHPPIPSISCDYGFLNCNTFEDTCTLMEIYRRVLEGVDPMDLHRACVAGRLFEFASAFLEMEEEWRLLLVNPYPLGRIFETEEVVEGQDRIRGKGERDVADGGAVDAYESPHPQIASPKGWCGVM
ncbi:hypothetical protein DM02DRAFT_689266 [Periconia macrospinosa]|uniref:MYND-type domain-containing protein n=1 Tax=Periconia macrospinosa TaxID=97972 RepID=A0A2V1DCF8_9PLEO|nr:hypothetical protein DM02DRAFT_689266 [Periconia macrospinosa]